MFKKSLIIFCLIVLLVVLSLAQFDISNDGGTQFVQGGKKGDPTPKPPKPPPPPPPARGLVSSLV